MKEYDLYLFDFDNTLFDTRTGIEAILKESLPALGVDYDPSHFGKYLGMSMDDIFASVSEDPTVHEDFINRFYKVVESDAYKGAEPFPEAPGVLRALKSDGKHIGIASGKRRYKIENLMADCGLDGIAEVIVGWDETELHKPSPDPIALAFSHFDVPKERTLYVGDSENDSLAAQAFGIDCAIVDRHVSGVEGIPCTFGIESLEELLDRSRSDQSLSGEPAEELGGLRHTRFRRSDEISDRFAVVHLDLTRQCEGAQVVHGHGLVLLRRLFQEIDGVVLPPLIEEDRP